MQWFIRMLKFMGTKPEIITCQQCSLDEAPFATSRLYNPDVAKGAPSRLQIGFVPTMGNLHQGHLSLLERCCTENDISVLSIFINPTQFNNKNDYTNYPQTLEQDLALAEKAKVDYILMPTYSELYPDDFAYQVSETKISQELEGKFRPGHFTGMLTVVLKLLLLVKAHRAYFGEKDYQQLQLIRGMAKSFFLETENYRMHYGAQ